MQPDYFDNRARIVKDDLVVQISHGDRLSVAASVFSMYAYRELREQLEGLDEFRFIFTSDAFTKSRPRRKSGSSTSHGFAASKGSSGRSSR